MSRLFISVERLDNWTNDANGGYELNGEKGMFRVGWNASWFTQNNKTLTWDNAYRLTNTFPYDASGYSNGNGAAFGPAVTVANGAQVLSPHGRSRDGAAVVRRSTPAKSGRGSREARGVRRAGPIPDPARPRLPARTPARRQPLPNEMKN